MDLSILDMAIRVVVGTVIGFMIGLTGIGGGVIVIPTLSLGLGLPPSVAVGTASLYAFASQIMAAIKHATLKNVDFKVAPVVLAGAIPADIAVSFAINDYIRQNAGSPEIIAAFQSHLKILIACVITLSALILLLNVVLAKKGSHDHSSALSRLIHRSVFARLTAGIVFGSIVGTLIGSTSVGAGVILIPTLMNIFGLSINRTVGTSVTIGFVLTLTTAIVFSHGGQVDYATALLMAAGSLLGVPQGAKLAARMHPDPLKKVMVVMVIAAGILMLFR